MAAVTACPAHVRCLSKEFANSFLPRLTLRGVSIAYGKHQSSLTRTPDPDKSNTTYFTMYICMLALAEGSLGFLTFPVAR